MRRIVDFLISLCRTKNARGVSSAAHGLRLRGSGRKCRLEALEQRALLTFGGAGQPIAGFPDSTSDYLAFDGELPLAADSSEQGTRFRIFEQWGGTWWDAEKDTQHGGSLMCWAASAANVLRWTGWGIAGGMTNPDQMFQYFREHWTDLGGLPRYGFRWWFDGKNSALGWPGYSQVTRPGANFYPSVTWTTQVFSRGQSATARNLAMADIDQYARAGYGVAVGLFGSLQHAVTCWGFNYDPNLSPSEPSYYKGIWISDSDDDKGTPDGTTAPDTLHYYAVVWDAANSRWSLESYYPGAYIGEVDALERPLPVIASLAGSPSPAGVGTPLALVASGVSDPRDAALSSVSVAFYRETNGDPGLQSGTGGDTLEGTDLSPSGGWTTSVSTLDLAPGDYTYYAQAVDSASGWKSAEGAAAPSATITLVNRAPVLADQTLVVTEHSPRGTVVGTVAATDPDDPSQALSFSIEAGNESGALAIDPVTGQLTVADSRLLDFDSAPSVRLTVRASDNGFPPLSSSATVTVNLIDLHPAITVGDLVLLPNTAGQVRQVQVTGQDYAAGLTFNIRVGDGLQPGNGPRITAVDVLGTASQPTIFYGNNTGQRDPDGEADARPYAETVQTTTASGTVLANGLLAVVSFDTTGVTAGTWDLVLADPAGVATDFAGGVADITNGTVYINQAPVLSALEGAALPYTENDPAAAITAAIAVGDVDSANLAGAVIQITGNYHSGQDLLSLAGTANITGTWDSSTGTLALSGFDTVANYQAALRAVTYQNTSESPSPLARTVSYRVNDGTADSNLLTRDITVDPVNDAPMLSEVEGTPLSYTENDSATAITAAIAVGDVDNANLAGAVIQITGNYHSGQDLLSLAGTANITGTWDSSTGTLALSGFDTVANYQAALRAVTYQNTSESPSPLARTVSYRVNDGTADSNLLIRAITVRPVADVKGRYIFYNSSLWDGETTGAAPEDDGAIAPPPGITGHGHTEPLDELDKELGKRALLPGQTASFVNYTSYSKGINGIMVDLDDLGNPGAIGAADFQFHVGNDNDPARWTLAPPPSQIAVRYLSDGVTRITVLWPDHDPQAAGSGSDTIANQWLQVIVLATPNTNLARPDTFYFGNAVGEAGDSSISAYVNPTDEIGARQHSHAYGSLASISDPYDFDRDQRVGPTDEFIARRNPTAYGNSLGLITVPADSPTGLSTGSNSDGSPTVTSQTFTLPEHSSVGSLVGTVVASDPDTGPESLRYSITAGNPGVFAIDPATGRITVANRQKLDYEVTRTFQLTVSVTDDASPPLSSTATISVSLVDVHASVVVGDLSLLPDTPDQTRPIWVSGDEFPFGLTFNVRVGDGLDPGGGPRIAGVDILGTADQPTVFYGSDTGAVDPDGEPDRYPYYETVQTTVANQAVRASGLLANITFDTTGVALGTWDLVLADPAGMPTDFAGDDIHITDGSLTVDRPPEARAGGTYLVGLGRDLHLDASRSADPDAPAGDRLASYAWDLDNDGQFDDLVTDSAVATVPYAELAALGEGSHVIGLRVVDQYGLAATDTATLDIKGGHVAGPSGDNSVRIACNPADPSQADVFINAMGPEPTYSVRLANLVQWHVAAGQGQDALTVDFSYGNPLPAAGLVFDGGPGDSIVIRGTPAEDSVAVTASQISLQGPAILGPAILDCGATEFSRFDLGAGQDRLRVDGGGVKLGGDNAISSNTTVTVTGGGWLDLGGSTATVRSLVLSGGRITNGVLQCDSNRVEEGTLDATLTGAGGLTKEGPGSVTATRSNRYLGGTTVNSGVLMVTHGDALPAGRSLTIGAGGTLVLSSGLGLPAQAGGAEPASSAVAAFAVNEIASPNYTAASSQAAEETVAAEAALARGLSPVSAMASLGRAVGPVSASPLPESSYSQCGHEPWATTQQQRATTAAQPVRRAGAMVPDVPHDAATYDALFGSAGGTLVWAGPTSRRDRLADGFAERRRDLADRWQRAMEWLLTTAW